MSAFDIFIIILCLGTVIFAFAMIFLKNKKFERYKDESNDIKNLENEIMVDRNDPADDENGELREILLKMESAYILYAYDEES